MVTFFERLGAYFIDILILSLLLGIVGYGLPDNTEEVNDKVEVLEEKLINNEISPEDYLKEYYVLLYDVQSSSKLANGISLVLTIAYFVVFQTLYNGQTLGKKLLKIKIVNNDNNSASMLQMLIRSLFTMSIFSSLFGIVMLFILPKDIYIYSYLGVISIESLFIIITIMFILYRKDKRGLHDVIARTMVVKEG
ncbi:MAG: RDD family protein [Bacilli bacterium]|nr:RDD family protein [Bacilli bacterium]